MKRDEHDGKLPTGVYPRERADGSTAYKAVFLVSEDPETGKQRFKTKTFDTPEEAEEWRVSQRASRRTGDLTEPCRERFGAYVRRWLDDVARREKRERTWEGYSAVFRRYVEEPPEDAPRIAHVRMDRLRTEHIDELYTYLLVERGLAASTVQNLHAVLLQSLEHARRRKAVPENWARTSGRPKDARGGSGTSPVSPDRVLSREDLTALLRAAREEGDRFALWFLLASTGMRPGEALGLRWGDLDLEARTLRVERTLVWVTGEGPKTSPPKTDNAIRTLHLPEPTVRVLGQHRREAMATGRIPSPAAFIFSTPEGKGLCWSNVSRRDWRRVCRRAGLGVMEAPPPKPEGQPGPRRRGRFRPSHRPYDLRHTFITHRVEDGANLRWLSEHVGHHDPAFTLSVYAGTMSEETHRKEADRIDLPDVLAG